MSGTKASNQQRTSKKAADFILRQRHNVGGAYGQGWNTACEILAAKILAGEHLEPVRPPAPLPKAPRCEWVEYIIGGSQAQCEDPGTEKINNKHFCVMHAKNVKTRGADPSHDPGVRKATAPSTVLRPTQDGSVAPASRCGVDGCIHQANHVERGQPLHSDGTRTWRDRK